MNVLIASILAVSPGCWDCLGLSDAQIVLAYEDDYDRHVGPIPSNDEYGHRTGSGAFGPEHNPGVGVNG
jgi:hypothetical protein